MELFASNAKKEFTTVITVHSLAETFHRSPVKRVLIITDICLFQLFFYKALEVSLLNFIKNHKEKEAFNICRYRRFSISLALHQAIAEKVVEMFIISKMKAEAGSKN